MRNLNREHGDAGDGLMVAIPVVFVVALLIVGAFFYGPTHTMTCTVDSKDRAASGYGSGSSMRLYTKDCDVLAIQDNYLHGFTTSASLYASIQAGKRYEFTTTGWRFGLTSSFPSVIAATEVTR